MSKIRYRSGYKYQLADSYEIRLPFFTPVFDTNHGFIKVTPDGLLIINEGYAWDGPSGPTVDTDNFMRGSLVHDALYQLMREGLLDREVYRQKADELLRQICIEDGMSSIRAWWVYQGVRVGGRSATLPRTNEVKCAP